MKVRLKTDIYGEACANAGTKLIPFAIETYGMMCGLALRHLKEVDRVQAAMTIDGELRPWFAPSFMVMAQQRLSAALQRSIYERQLLRSHRLRGSPGSSSESSSSDSSGKDY